MRIFPQTSWLCCRAFINNLSKISLGWLACDSLNSGWFSSREPSVILEGSQSDCHLPLLRRCFLSTPLSVWRSGFHWGLQKVPFDTEGKGMAQGPGGAALDRGGEVPELLAQGHRLLLGRCCSTADSFSCSLLSSGFWLLKLYPGC